MAIQKTAPHLLLRPRCRYAESDLQTACVHWFRLQYPSLSLCLFAVPNGGSRNSREAARMKGEGVTAGVADLILLVPRGTYASLCIEMKSPAGRVRPAQKAWRQAVETAGNRYVVCRSLDGFMAAVNDYLAGK